jgi:hypothetical protein
MPARPTRLKLDTLEIRDIPASPNLLATFDTGSLPPSVGEFTVGGTLLRSEANPPAPNSTSNGPHDVDVTADGRWVVFNGHFETSLNVYDPVTDTWQQGTFPGWTSVGNDSYGGLTTAGNYVYVPDMFTYNGGEPTGIVRFDLDDLSAQRFASGTEYTDLNIGLDGLLYALRGDYGPIDVYNPRSMVKLRTVTPTSGGTYRGVTADADGNLFVIDWNEDLWKFSPTGQTLASVDLSAATQNDVSDTHDVDISNDGQYLVVGSRFGWVVHLTTAFTGVTRFRAGDARNAHATFLEPPPNIDPIELRATGLSTDVGEDGATDTYTVVLRQAPTSPVTVSLAPGAGLQVAPESLTFTTANWNVPQTVTVSAVDNNVDDGPRAGDIAHTMSSLDPAFNSPDPYSLAVTIADDDEAGITITPTEDLSFTEGDAGDSYQIALNSQPVADVTFTLSATGPVTLSDTTLTFTPANWNVPRTVTATSEDDEEVEGTESGSVSLSVASLDPLYDGQALPTFAVTVADDDRGIIVTGGPSVSEAGGSAGYNLALSAAPTSDVLVTLTPDSQIQVSPPSVLFTPANWNVPQTVTVSAVDDLTVEGNHAGFVSLAATSGDPEYDGLAIPDVSVAIADNDTPAVVVTPTSGLIVHESGTTATFSVRLTTVPSQPVTISLSSSDPTQGVVSPASLTFLPEEGLTEKVVTVTGIDDTAVDADVTFQIVTSAAQSADPTYNGLAVADVDVVNRNNDVALPSNTFRFTDRDGDRVTIRLRGPGSLTASMSENFEVYESLRLVSGDPSKSRLSIKVARAAGTGDGVMELDSIEGTAAVSVIAPKVDLVGSGIRFDSLDRLTVRDLKNGADVQVGSPRTSLRVGLGDVGGGSDIAVGAGRVRSIRGARFGDGGIAVDRLDQLRIVGDGKRGIPGDFRGSVTVRTVPPPPTEFALGRVVIKGTVEDATFQVTGNVGSFASGQFVDSRLFVGYVPASPTAPLDGGTFTGKTIDSFTVLGLKNQPTSALANSFVVASGIDVVKLVSVNPDNGGTPFGFLTEVEIGKSNVAEAGDFKLRVTPP